MKQPGSVIAIYDFLPYYQDTCIARYPQGDSQMSVKNQS